MGCYENGLEQGLRFVKMLYCGLGFGHGLRHWFGQIHDCGHGQDFGHEFEHGQILDTVVRSSTV